jgi:hypothetical protein
LAILWLGLRRLLGRAAGVPGGGFVEQIENLVKAIKALQEDGYHVSHGDHFVEKTVISDIEETLKRRVISFSLYKDFPIEGKEEELKELIQSLNRSYPTSERPLPREHQ